MYGVFRFILAVVFAGAGVALAAYLIESSDKSSGTPVASAIPATNSAPRPVRLPALPPVEPNQLSPNQLRPRPVRPAESGSNSAATVIPVSHMESSELSGPDDHLVQDLVGLLKTIQGASAKKPAGDSDASSPHIDRLTTQAGDGKSQPLSS